MMTTTTTTTDTTVLAQVAPIVARMGNYDLVEFYTDSARNGWTEWALGAKVEILARMSN